MSGPTPSASLSYSPGERQCDAENDFALWPSQMRRLKLGSKMGSSATDETKKGDESVGNRIARAKDSSDHPTGGVGPGISDTSSRKVDLRSLFGLPSDYLLRLDSFLPESFVQKRKRIEKEAVRATTASGSKRRGLLKPHVRPKLPSFLLQSSLKGLQDADSRKPSERKPRREPRPYAPHALTQTALETGYPAETYYVCFIRSTRQNLPARFFGSDQEKVIESVDAIAPQDAQHLQLECKTCSTCFLKAKRAEERLLNPLSGRALAFFTRQILGLNTTVQRFPGSVKQGDREGEHVDIVAMRKVKGCKVIGAFKERPWFDHYSQDMLFCGGCLKHVGYFFALLIPVRRALLLIQKQVRGYQARRYVLLVRMAVRRWRRRALARGYRQFYELFQVVYRKKLQRCFSDAIRRRGKLCMWNWAWPRWCEAGARHHRVRVRAAGVIQRAVRRFLTRRRLREARKAREAQLRDTYTVKRVGGGFLQEVPADRGGTSVSLAKQGPAADCDPFEGSFRSEHATSRRPSSAGLGRKSGGTGGQAPAPAQGGCTVAVPFGNHSAQRRRRPSAGEPVSQPTTASGTQPIASSQRRDHSLTRPTQTRQEGGDAPMSSVAAGVAAKAKGSQRKLARPPLRRSNTDSAIPLKVGTAEATEAAGPVSASQKRINQVRQAMTPVPFGNRMEERLARRKNQKTVPVQQATSSGFSVLYKLDL